MTSWVPQACTLPTEEQPLRVAEFDALFAEALVSVEREGVGRVRLFLDRAAEERARELSDQETACCAFFTFAFAGDSEGRLVMSVEAPAEQAAVVEALAQRAEAALAAS